MLRFLAALMVTLFHLNQAITPVDNWYRNTINHGWLGVPVFFVISGYCIIASAYHTQDTKQFLIKRFFRIFPPYWISLIVVCFSAVFQKIYTGTNSVHNLPYDLPAVMANITLGTAPLSKIETINWVYWSLTCEVAFYLLIAFGMLLNKKYLLHLMFIITLFSAFMPKQGYGLLFFLDHWPAFGIGISIYYYFLISSRKSALNFGLLFAGNIYALYHKHANKPEYLMAALVTLALIYLSNNYAIKNNFLAKLGQYSYSVYLIHIPVGVFIVALFENEQIKTTPYLNLIYDLSVFAFISLLAYMMYMMVEKPSMRYGNELIEKKSSSSFLNRKKQIDTADH